MPPEIEAVEEVSLGDTIREQFEKSTETETVVSGEPAKEGQPRAPDGKFAPKDADAANTAPKIETPAAAAANPAVDPAKPVDPNAPVVPPVQEFKQPLDWKHGPEKWAQLDPAAKEYFKNREAAYNRGIQQYSQMAKVGDILLSECKPYEGLINSLGANPQTAMRFLLHSYATLKTGTPAQKAQIIASLAQEEGIDLADIVTNGVPRVDPEIQRIRDTQDQILRALRQQHAPQQSQQSQHQESEVLAQVEAFAANPAHEHFERARPLMVAFLQNGQAKTLDEAYDAALWTLPDTRASKLSQREAQEATKRKQEAEAAKRAGVSLRAAPTGPAGTGDLSLRDEIARNFASA